MIIMCPKLLTTRYMTPLPGGRFALRGHFDSVSTLRQNVSYIETVGCHSAEEIFWEKI